MQAAWPRRGLGQHLKSPQTKNQAVAWFFVFAIKPGHPGQHHQALGARAAFDPATALWWP